MRSNWLPIALAVSVGINLLVAGVFIGSKLRGADPVLDNPVFAIGHAVRGLDDERRAELLPRVREHYRSVRPHMRELRIVQHRLRRAFGEEELDLAAVDAAHAELTQELATIQNLSHGTLKAVLQNMGVQERAEFLAAMEHSAARHHEERRRRVRDERHSMPRSPRPE